MEEGHGRREPASLPPVLQITPEALRQMIEDASAQAASRAVAQYVAEHAVPPRPSRYPCRGQDPLAPENSELRPVGTRADTHFEEEVNSRPSLPEEELPLPLPRGAPPRGHVSYGMEQAPEKQVSSGKAENLPPLPLAVAPPRRSPFATHILAEAIQPGIKLPNISEYDGTKDPQDHLDRFLAQADLLDISDAVYCKIFRTTLASKAMAWFNQLSAGSIENFEQFSQRFLHHFAINKRYPKTASYLFTIMQREHESLRDYVQRFSEAVLEVPHVNPELLASIMQQNLRRGRFRDSIAGKPPATLDELLARAEKYIRIEETSGPRLATSIKRRPNDGERPGPQGGENPMRERNHVPPTNMARYTPLNAPRA